MAIVLVRPIGARAATDEQNEPASDYTQVTPWLRTVSPDSRGWHPKGVMVRAGDGWRPTQRHGNAQTVVFASGSRVLFMDVAGYRLFRSDGSWEPLRAWACRVGAAYVSSGGDALVCVTGAEHRLVQREWWHSGPVAFGRVLRITRMDVDGGILTDEAVPLPEACYEARLRGFLDDGRLLFKARCDQGLKLLAVGQGSFQVLQPAVSALSESCGERALSWPKVLPGLGVHEPLEAVLHAAGPLVSNGMCRRF